MIWQILLTLICTLFIYIWFKKVNSRLPPGPARLPILGSVIQLHKANPHFPHLAMAKLAEKYGDIMSFGFGMQTAVVISSFEAMKDVFQRIDTNTHRYEFPYVFDRNYGQNLGILWSSGETWTQVRKFTMKSIKGFGYGKPKITDESLADSANQLIDSIKMELLDSSDGSYFVFSQKFAIHVVNVLWNSVGGYKFDPKDELIKRNMECCDKVVDIVGHSNPYNMFPFLKSWFPNHVRYPEHLKIHGDIHDFTKTLINDAKKKRNERLDSEPTSFIEVFLDKIEDNLGNPDTIFTQEQLEIILEDLFLAGLETTGTFLAWSILFLVQNPDTQTKLRKEIVDKLGNSNDCLQSNELKKVPYVKATVVEILRMGNVVPVPLPRYATLEFELRDYIIPKGAVLFYNLYPMYNDTNYWQDPENFRPERFLNECGVIDQLRSERVLNTVFGMGPRVCFGESIALDALFMFLAAMIINFKFESIPGQEPSAENPHSGLCLCPNKYCVRLTTVPIQ